MQTLITAIIALIQTVLGSGVVTSSTTQSILDALVQLVPVLVKEAQDLVPVVKNIIAALSADPSTTPQQLAALQELDAKVDAEFEAAAQAALDEDVKESE